MIKNKTYVLVMQITVEDEAALAQSARIKAREGGLSDEDWIARRQNAACDLEIVLNPLYGIGFHVNHAACRSGTVEV